MRPMKTQDQARRYAEAVAAVNRGDWSQAQQLSMYLLRELPSHPDVCFLAGIAALYQHQAPLAVSCLQRAVQLDPTRADALAQLARALATMSRTAEATELARRALAQSPDDPMTLDTLGVVFTQGTEYATAADLFRRVIALEPGQASYRFNFATSLIFAGKIDAAEGELEACLALDPRYWKAHLTLAQQRRQTPAHNHIERLRAALEDAGDDADAVMYLNLAMAKELEDLEDYRQAFAALVRGKSAGAPRGGSSQRDDALFEAIERSFPGPAPATTGFASDVPIFVFGMPRTGTTLVERILSSHPDVQSAGELQDFGVALKRASGSRTPAVLDVDTFERSRVIDWTQLGKAYITATRARAAGKPHFIDKLPHNFLYAGHIANALPKARLICVRRDPLDTCLSNFRQLFSRDSLYYDYSFDLLDTGRYYLRFNRLMEFWRRQFPGRILEIDYEAVVEEQEASTRRLLEFCGLPWSDACLHFERNAAPVATASAVQVRKPIYRTSMQRWRHYGPELQPLIRLLDEAGIPHAAGAGGRDALLDRLDRTAAEAIARGDWNTARDLGSRMLLLAPGDARSLFTAGVAALRLHEVPLAIRHLKHAVSLDPSNAESFAELARALVTTGEVAEAVAAADRAVALSPEAGGTFDMLGVVYGQANFHARAETAFRRAVELAPDNAAFRFNLASAHVFSGDIDAAEAELEACLRIDPGHWRGHLFLSHLRRQTPRRNHVERLRAALGRHRQPPARLNLNLALAKELEDLGRYPEAFAHLAAGKQAGGEGRGYRTEHDVALFDVVAGCFPEPIQAVDGFASDEAIFVMGMPRTGTTLVDRILSSHPDVHSAGELRNFLIALQRNSGTSPSFVFDPSFAEGVRKMDWKKLGDDYLASTRPGTGHTRRFVDKLPHNFLYAGFIARALPNAKIVCLRRDPVDTCLSNFKQLFALDSAYFDYSFDLMDTGRYYLMFDRLMAHWQRVLPGRILELRYEDLVDDQRGSTGRLLDFCGLEWHDACLRFERNEAPVATASAVQVRTPMNRDSIGRWKLYRPQLSALLELLERAGVVPG
jgi:tetratricopeptide (TPR) repeat protein